MSEESAVHGSPFPDEGYLRLLFLGMRQKRERFQGVMDHIQSESGALLNWTGYYLTDPNIAWERRSIPVDDLWLTGMGPAENAVIIDRCNRSPALLREALRTDPDVCELFYDATMNTMPILVRYEKGELKVLDGMHRAVAAIRDGVEKISAWVGTPTGEPRPQCEPHVVYDAIVAYQRGINPDRAGLVTTLRFFARAYSNIPLLLRERFSRGWLPDDDAQAIINEALEGLEPESPDFAEV